MKPQSAKTSKASPKRKAPQNGKLDKPLKIGQIYDLHRDEWYCASHES
jgi:hypothetical protein